MNIHTPEKIVFKWPLVNSDQLLLPNNYRSDYIFLGDEFKNYFKFHSFLGFPISNKGFELILPQF